MASKLDPGMAEPKAEPFRATRLWNDIIAHLKVHTSVGRHRHFFKHYDDVFSGNNAVDVVFGFLQRSGPIINQEVTRNNAVKVCQALMDHGLFQAVLGKGSLFEDSGGKLYRFRQSQRRTDNRKASCSVPQDTVRDGEPSESVDCPDGQPLPMLVPLGRRGSYAKRRAASLDSAVDLVTETSRCTSPISQDTSPSSSAASVNRAILKRRHSFLAAMRHESHRRIERPSTSSKKTGSETFVRRGNGNLGFLVRSSLRRSLCRMRSRDVAAFGATSKYTTALDDTCTELQVEIRACALSHLLAAVDIPVLEGILSVSSNLPAVSPYSQNLVIQNNCVTSAADGNGCDLSRDYAKFPWVAAAAACIGKLPDNVGNLWSAQACKIYCYRAVLECCRFMPAPILPGEYLQIYLAVLQLVTSGQRGKALAVAQLLVVVLPRQRREQLQKLLNFLKMVQDDLFVLVDSHESNRETILHDFTCVVISHPLLSHEYCALLLDFLLSRVSLLFTPPAWLSQRQLSGPRFCEQITQQEYDHQCADAVYHLQDLLNCIMMSPMACKEKKYWVNRFRKVHPELHWEEEKENLC